MRDRTLVLGSGISALAYLYYNPNAFALTGDQVGGLFRQADSLGPQYIWKTKSTTKLFNELGITPPTRQIKVGYWWKSELYEQDELDGPTLLQIKTMYAKRTRGVAPKDSFMSSGKGEFEIYDLPVQTLVTILLEKVGLRLIPKKASAIDLYRQRVYTPESFTMNYFEYDTLVSTVPAPVFLSLIGAQEQTKNLRGYDKVYERLVFQTKKNPHLIEQRALDRGMDYVYLPEQVIDGGYDFHRTRIMAGGPTFDVVREYTLIDGMVPPTKGKKQPNGQIISGHEVLESLPKNVELLGRYAEWKHGIRLENVLEAIQ